MIAIKSIEWDTLWTSDYPNSTWNTPSTCLVMLEIFGLPPRRCKCISIPTCHSWFNPRWELAFFMCWVRMPMRNILLWSVRIVIYLRWSNYLTDKKIANIATRICAIVALFKFKLFAWSQISQSSYFTGWVIACSNFLLRFQKTNFSIRQIKLRKLRQLIRSCWIDRPLWVYIK